MRWTEGFIAVDWGTTNRRAYRIDAQGNRGDEFEDHKGVLSIGGDGFPDAVAEIRQRLGDLPLLLAGMIGSNRGWKEAPYVPCPAGIDELAKGIVWTGEREAIVPGVSYIGNGRADVMRGSAAARRRRRGLGRSDGARLPSRDAQQVGDLATRKDRRVPDGDDRRAVQPAQRPQHPVRPAPG
jgi:hypothetical protein